LKEDFVKIKILGVPPKGGTPREQARKTACLSILLDAKSIKKFQKNFIFKIIERLYN
jgi:hypothetical protein